MPNPLPSELHVDSYLTNLSVAFVQGNNQFIADKVFPVVPVQKQSDKYPVYDRGYFWRDEVAPRPLGGRNRVIGYKVTDETYVCEEYGIGHYIDDRVRANADQPLNPDRAATRLVTTQMMIHRDRMWAEAYFKPGVWTTDLTGVAATPGAGQFLQFDQASSTPVKTITEMKDAVLQLTGYEPNVLVMGRKVYRTLKEHPDIIERVKYTQRGIITPDILASMFEIEKVLIPGAVYNTGAEGAPNTFEFIVPDNDMLMVYAAPNPGLEVPSGGYIFAWTGLIPGETNAFGGVIERGRDGMAHSDYIECRAAFSMHVVAPDLGVFFDNAVA